MRILVGQSGISHKHSVGRWYLFGSHESKSHAKMGMPYHGDKIVTQKELNLNGLIM